MGEGCQPRGVPPALDPALQGLPPACPRTPSTEQWPQASLGGEASTAGPASGAERRGERRGSGGAFPPSPKTRSAYVPIVAEGLLVAAQPDEKIGSGSVGGGELGVVRHDLSIEA